MNCRVLDEERFRQNCQLLLQCSDQLGDGWSWEAVQGSEEGYLRKTALRSVPSDWGPLLKHEGVGFHPASVCDSARHGNEKPGPVVSSATDGLKAVMVEEDDGSCTATSSDGLVLQYEYHILYSCSYAAPVLYFRAFTQEGRSLTLEEMWSTIHPNYRFCLQNCPLNAVSQQEHPFLGQPFFFLHPCRTEGFMGQVLQAAQDHNTPVNYVLSWLSTVGPVVGLDVSLKYSTCLHPAVSLSSSKCDRSCSC